MESNPLRGAFMGHNNMSIRFLFVSCMLTLCSITLADAALASSRQQETKMIRAVVVVSERLSSGWPSYFKKNDSLQTLIIATRKRISDLESGILTDMNIASDVATIMVHAQWSGALSKETIASFDGAASYCSMEDQARYFAAKARIVGELIALSPAKDSVIVWLGRVVDDWCNAVTNGYESRKATNTISSLVDELGFKDLFVNSFQCRIVQSSAQFSIKKVRLLKARHKEKAALEFACRAVRTIPPTMNLKAGACEVVDKQEILANYIALLIMPLRIALGNGSDVLILQTCDEFWDEKTLVRRLLPSVRVPSKLAYQTFSKAARDDDLKGDKEIALAEYLIWKRDGKARLFRKDFPERYKLAQWKAYKVKK